VSRGCPARFAFPVRRVRVLGTTLTSGNFRCRDSETRSGESQRFRHPDGNGREFSRTRRVDRGGLRLLVRVEPQQVGWQFPEGFTTTVWTARELVWLFDSTLSSKAEVLN